MATKYGWSYYKALFGLTYHMSDLLGGGHNSKFIYLLRVIKRKNDFLYNL